MTKEAAILRLLDRWRAEDKELAQYIAEALAAERRATVERIDAWLMIRKDQIGGDPHYTYSEIRARLDEEEAR